MTESSATAVLPSSHSHSPSPARARPRWFLPGIALTFCAVAVGAELARSQAVLGRKAWPPEADELYMPGSDVLRRSSLGHVEMMADLVAARTNVYFGGQLGEKGKQKWLAFYLNAVVDLDPYFEPIYLRSAAMLIYNGTTPNLESFMAADKIMERGLKYFPDNWELQFQFGFNRAYEMPTFVPKTSPRYAQWKKQGTEALRRATLSDGLPGYIASMVARMLTDQGERDLAIQHLERTYAIASDPEARRQIGFKLKQLLGEQYTATFEVEAARVENLIKNNFPYAPEAFAIVAGERPRPWIDIKSLGAREIDPRSVRVAGPGGTGGAPAAPTPLTRPK